MQKVAGHCRVSGRVSLTAPARLGSAAQLELGSPGSSWTTWCEHQEIRLLNSRDWAWRWRVAVEGVEQIFLRALRGWRRRPGNSLTWTSSCLFGPVRSSIYLNPYVPARLTPAIVTSDRIGSGQRRHVGPGPAIRKISRGRFNGRRDLCSFFLHTY